ncbi:sialic acid-binding Ig-like lectin 10 [Hyla sarda]|uniref:sialic acid-binding Ig-like lectin 10 n=1 Tax=Hyla sarda TaxID=327740 RepID=UPI0024C3BD01|nr:sialic acid-binding Ig-like lectin 10 [Hyla sarda]
MVLLNLKYCTVLIFLVIQIWDNGCEANGYIIHVPKEVTAQVGLCVHVPCQFTVPSDVTISRNPWGFWYRPWSAKELVASNYDWPKKRMFFTGDVSKKDCSLFINDVQKSDGNTYQFRLEDSERYNYHNILPRLTVTDLTDKPEISVRKLIAGEKATITCRSPGVCAGSAPVITWNRRDGKPLAFNNTYPNRTKIYYSNFTFTPSKGDNGSPLECRVSFLHNMAETQQTINLIVEYPPGATITTEVGATDNPLIVKEGDRKTINCMVDSNPIAEITWFVGYKVIKGPTKEHTLIYNLNNIGPRDAGKYLCFGNNDHGNSTRAMDIIVHYAPRTPNIMCSTTKDCTLNTQHVIHVMENSTFSLLCTAESLPEASLSWKTPGSGNNQSRVNGHLTVFYVSLSDEGRFTCAASNVYGKSTSSVNIKVTYKPRTVTGKNSSCWTQGGGIVCTCIIQSFPSPNIEWNIDEKSYPSNHIDKELNIFTITLNGLTNSTLRVTSSRNIRTIRCMTSNEHGKLHLLLYTHSDFTTIIVATSCVVVIVVLLLIGGFLVRHCFRRKKLSDKAEDKKEISPDDSSVIYSNSDVHLYGNQTTETGDNSVYSVQDNMDASVYMNVEDMNYATINFSKLKPHHEAPEDIEIEYAEIKK